MPAPETLVMMVRGVLTGVNQANFTGNYSVLHAMTAPALQARVSAAQFGKAFANLRAQNLDLSPVLVLLPQFSVVPLLTPDGVLKLTGFFPSRPVQINFAIDYRPVDRFWMIEALSVSALQANASAQTAAAIPVSSTENRPTVPLKASAWATDVSTLVFGQSLSFVATPQ